MKMKFNCVIIAIVFAVELTGSLQAAEVGWSALHRAVGEANPIKTRIEAMMPGVNLNATDADGNTPLHIAVNSTGALFTNAELAIRQAIITILVRLKANINATNKDGDTPLAFAAKFSDLNAVEQLLKLGANPNVENNNQKTARNIAEENFFQARLFNYRYPAGRRLAAHEDILIALVGDLEEAQIIMDRLDAEAEAIAKAEAASKKTQQ